ncbi:MAG TPA: cache domain-containing protein [Noviherbaspirillum sp.]
MKKLFQAMLIMIAASCALAVHAQVRGSKEEAVALVHKVIAYIKANGKEKAFAAVNNGQFHDRDLYVTINSPENLNYAHGANPRMIGKDLSDIKDVDGKYYMRERREMLKTKSSGWHDYKFVNPMTKQIEKKSMYFERYEDVVVGCGVYTP